jgi:hypothetical protein
VNVFLHLVGDSIGLLLLCPSHSVFPEPFLASVLDFLDTLHTENGIDHKVPIVLDRRVSSLFELKRFVNCHILPMCKSVGLGPLHLARITLHLEVLVAL